MKQTHSDNRFWLLITIATALVCAAARRWQLLTAFEGDLRLPIPMAPATVILVLLVLLCAAGLFLLARKQPVARTLYQAPDLAMDANQNALFMGALVCAAFLTLIAAPVLFRNGHRMWTAYQAALAAAKAHGGSVPGGNNGVLTLATAVTSILAFLGLLLTGKAAYRSIRKGRLAILLPAINCCLWLMEVYRSHAANPIQWDYAPLLLAIVSGILFYLDWAGLYAGAGAPRRTLWLAAMTVIFSATALAGEWSLSDALLLTAQLLAALAILWLVPNNLRYPPEIPAEEVQAEEKLEEETHE